MESKVVKPVHLGNAVLAANVKICTIFSLDFSPISFRIIRNNHIFFLVSLMEKNRESGANPGRTHRCK